MTKPGVSFEMVDEKARAEAVIAKGKPAYAVALAQDSLALQDEVRRMDRVLRREAEPVFEPMRADSEGVSMPIRDSSVTKLIVGMLAEMLGTSENYTQISAWHPVAGRIECIVRRVGKLSPHEARHQAERHLARAVALLREHGIAWDGPTEFLPDAPTLREIPADDDAPWLVIDAKVQPNDLWCQRCDGRQSMPERMTADVAKAMMAAFKGQHVDCQEGDAR